MSNNLGTVRTDEACGATWSRYVEAESAITRQQLSESPALCADTIAHHYASLAATAMYLRELVQLWRHGNRTPELAGMIDHIVDRIRANHLADFGIPLEWPATLPRKE